MAINFESIDREIRPPDLMACKKDCPHANWSKSIYTNIEKEDFQPISFYIKEGVKEIKEGEYQIININVQCYCKLYFRKTFDVSKIGNSIKKHELDLRFECEGKGD